MKRIALALFAAAGLAVSAARADRVDVRASINIGAPAYVTPVHAPVYGPVYGGRGYWRDVTTRVWIPGHWVVARDYYGRPCNQWSPGRYELRTNRVWVDGRDNRRRDDWHDQDRWEHARRDDHDRRDRDDHRWYR